jgi:hypothetical protein
MRKSRVLLAGVAVAAAAAGTSAFTGSNTMPTPTHLGYGEITATGATITQIHYTPNGTDASNIDSVVFTTTTDISGQVATMTLKSGGSVIATYTPCALSAYSVTMTITCDTSGSARTFQDFDAVGLTIGQ